MKNKLLTTLFILFIAQVMHAQPLSVGLPQHNPVVKIVPQPFEVIMGTAYLKLSTPTKIYTDFYEAVNEMQMLESLFKITDSTKVEVIFDKSGITDNASYISIIKDSLLIYPDEYTVTVDKKGIEIKAAQPAGVFYAIQTLRQIIFTNATELPYMAIHDKPRFQFRSLMLDPARNFLPVNQLEKLIDAMAMYKYNRLHLHLTDDQGWRVEIKNLPQLTDVGAISKNRTETDDNSKNYYTQEQLKYLVKYAAERHIEIIPEINIPAHSVAALAAFPKLSCRQRLLKVSTTTEISKEVLCAGNQQVYDFFDIILDELAPIFPSKTFHIGGNNVSFDNWKKCPKCQQTIKENNLKGEHELLSYFFNRVSTILHEHNKEPMFWYDPVVPNYPLHSTMLLWQMNTPQKQIDEICKKGYPLVCAPTDYANFNYPQWRGDIPDCTPTTTLPLQQAYEFEPTFNLSSQQTNCIIGAQAVLWGEHVPNIDRAFYMIFPRALAMSEVAWSDRKNRSWENFKDKLDVQLNFLLKHGISFRPPTELYTNQ